MTEERKIQLIAEVDTTRTRAGFSEIARQGETMASNVTRSGQQAASSINNIGNGADTAARRVESSQRNLISSIQRTTAAMEAGSKTGAAYYETLARQRGVDPAVLAPYLAQLRAVEAAQARANEQTRLANPALQNLGASAAQTAAALRGVPAQFSDIIASLQGGQSPISVFLQQGGQLKDMFGGAGTAAKALGSYIVGLLNPITLATGAAVLLAVAYHQGALEAEGYRKSIILSGNAAGTSANQLGNLARSISASVGTQGAAAEALNAMVLTGRVSAQNLEKFSKTAVDAQRALGQSVGDTATQFAELGKSPLSALEKLNEQYHFLTPSVYETVKALDMQGRTLEAGKIAQEAYATSFDGVAESVSKNLGALQRLWIGVKDAAAGSWDAMLNVGRKNSLEQELADVRKEIARAQRAPTAGGYDDMIGGKGEVRGQLPANLAKEAALVKQIAAEEHIARLKGEQVAFDTADISWKKEADKYLSRQQQFENAITANREKGMAAGISDQEIRKRAIEIEKSYADIVNKGTEAQIEALKHRAALEDVSNKRKQDRVSFEGRTGQLTSESQINQSADIDAAASARQKSFLEQQIVLVKRKQNSLKEQAALRAQIETVEAQADSREEKRKQDLFELEQKYTRTAADNYATLIEGAMAQRNALQDQAQSEQDNANQIGLTKAQVVALTAARLNDAAARKDAEAADAEGLDSGGQMTEIYRAQAQALRDRAAAMVAGSNKELTLDTVRANELLVLMTSLDDIAKSAAEGMAAAFGKVGKAIGGMTTALSGFGKAQAAIDAEKAQALSRAAGDPGKIRAAELKASQESSTAQIRQYGQMADAAQSFFDKGSRGYQAIGAASKVMHAAELAMNIASIAPAMAAGAAQFFAQSGWGGFAGVAAMAAVVAGFGVAVSSNSSKGGPASGDVQKTQGTGTVFGDTSAKSESTTRLLDLIQKNTYQGLDYFPGMLVALRSIESGVGALGNLIAGTNGLTNGKAFGVKEGQISKLGAPSDVLSRAATEVTKGLFGPGLGDKIAGFINNLYGKTTQKIIDSGISFGGSLNDLQGGKGYNQYASVDTTKSTFFGLSKKTTNSMQSAGLDGALAEQFGQIFTGLETTLRTAATGLGLNADDVSKSLDALVLKTTTLSLKDLKGDDLTAAINAVISGALDQISEAAFPSFKEFRKLGEGFAETVVRVAQDFQAIDTVFASFGKTFGQIGMESIAARERLIDMAGGLDKFTAQGEYFLKNFFTEKEQTDALKKRIAPTLEKYGLSTEGEGATKALKDFIVGLKTTTAEGAEAYSTLMLIAPAFMDIVKAGRAIFDQRDDLRNQLDDLTMTASQMATKKRGAVDPSNLGLYDQLQAATAARALETVNKTYQDQIDAFVKSTLTVTELRKLETEGMADSTAVLYDRLAALKKGAADDAVIAAKRDAIKSADDGFQSQIDGILKLNMKPEELRAFETKGMADSTIVLYDRLQGLKAEQAAQQAAAAAATAAATAQQQAAQESQRAAEALRDAWKSATDSIFDEVKRIRGLIDGNGAATFAGAQAEFAITSAQARAGDIEATKLLPQLSQTLLELAATNAATSLDLARIRAQTLSSLIDVGSTISSKNGFLLPSLAIGTNYLPQDSVIQAHEGERIIPAADNRALFAAIDRSSGSTASEAQKALREEVVGLRAETRATALHTSKMAAAFDRIVEGDYMKTKEVPA